MSKPQDTDLQLSIDEMILLDDEEEEEKPHISEDMIQPEKKPKVELPAPQDKVWISSVIFAWYPFLKIFMLFCLNLISTTKNRDSQPCSSQFICFQTTQIDSVICNPWPVKSSAPV